MLKSDLDIIDSPFEHIVEWEANHIYLPNYKELIGSEYQEYPRGRVLFDRTIERFIVYLDTTINTQQVRKRIKINFGLVNKKLLWKSDPHYKVFTCLFD